MAALSLYFTAPYQIDIRDEDLPEPAAGQVLVQSQLSGISPGTEMLFYRGQFPQEMTVDASIAPLSGQSGYPLKYGYSLTGQVVTAGPGVDPAWVGRRVFAFHPHESHFIASPQDLIPIPEGITLEDAIFLPNMETAVNFLLDGKPLIGERVAIFGQGIVGLLTTALLSRFPLRCLVTLDHYPARRQASLQSGAQLSLDPDDPETDQQLENFFLEGADLVYELSGSPVALDAAIALAGFDSRVIVGSWYGQKRAALDLGGRFHRNRTRLISSQVSTLAPELCGRWDKARRFDVAWGMLRQVRPARWITQQYTISDAARAYTQIDQHPEETIQVILTYPN